MEEEEEVEKVKEDEELEILNEEGGYHCLSGSLIICYKLPGKVGGYFRVLRKWDADQVV